MKMSFGNSVRIQFVQRIENQDFRLLLFAELGEVKLVGALEVLVRRATRGIARKSPDVS